MDSHHKKIPKSVLAFYVKIYCKRRGISGKSCHKTLIEATKSWLSLSKSEKQHIILKYNEYQRKIKESFADNLKKVEPYLKKKNVKDKSTTNIKNISKSIEKNRTLNETKQEWEENVQEYDSFEIQDVVTSVTPQPIHTSDNKHVEQNNAIHETKQELVENLREDKPFELQDEVFELQDEVISVTPQPIHANNNKQLLTEQDNISSDDQDNILPISEPVPPKFITGEQLFKIVNEKQENHLQWENLPELEKKRYRNAILAIKKNYLREYMVYLEQLAPKKLLNHYKCMLE